MGTRLIVLACYLSLKTLLFIYISYELYIDIEETVTGNLNNYHIMIVKLINIDQNHVSIFNLLKCKRA